MPHAMAMSFSVGSEFVVQVQRVCVEQTGNAVLRHLAAASEALLHPRFNNVTFPSGCGF